MKYKISDLSKILGITGMTLRRYEKNGYLTPERDESDYRLYHTSDITRIAQIRLLRKCGFTHETIQEALGNTHENIQEIMKKRMDELDDEINRLTFLRHWLKDNIKLMETVKEIGDGFILFNPPPLRYVLYSIGDQLLTEKGRLDTIHDFMYATEEVQQIQLYLQADIERSQLIPHRGWAIKEMDISRLHLESIVENNKFVESYSQGECIFGTINLPTDLSNTPEERMPYITAFLERKDSFLKAHQCTQSGDVCCFLVDTLGSVTYVLVCIPVARDSV